MFNKTFRQAVCSLTVAFAAIVMSLAPMDAHAGDPAKYIENVGNQALGIISNPSFNKEQKQDELEKLFAGSVDIQWVGRFVMGRYWRQATDEQKANYLKQYESFLLQHYTSRFANYTGGTFKITGAREDGENEFTVGMEMLSNDKSAEPILVDYRLRKSDGGFRIFDIIVEGVSLITTQRSEFGAVLSRNGIDYLIHQLETRSIPVNTGTK